MSFTEKTKFVLATKDDLDSILNIILTSYQKWVPIIGRKPTPMTADYTKSINEHDIYLLKSDKNIFGLIEIIKKENHIWIENVSVHPKHQGNGFGKKLLLHAEYIASINEFEFIRLQTNKEFYENIKLYNNFGYKIIREEPFMGGKTVYMEKNIHSFSEPNTRPSIA